MPSPPVVVIGSFVQDLFFETPAFPRPGQSVVGTFRTAPGGKGFNQAIAAARAGARTGFVGALGRDDFGAGARAFLAAEGVEFHGIEAANQSSGTAVVMVDASGQNQIIVSLGANESLAGGDFPNPWLAGATIVVSQLEICLPVAAEALRRAHAYGATTILNPAPMRAEFDPAMLAQVDILVPNESEFAALVNRAAGAGGAGIEEDVLITLPTAELQSLCRKLGPRLVLVTLGERGCLLSCPDRAVALPALAGVQAVDTTGAGDAFIGAFAAAYLEFDGDAERAARFANTVAGLSIQRPGAAPAMPRRLEIDAAISSR